MPRQDPRLDSIPDNFNERIQDRTIRHMLFLEGLKTRQANEVDQFIVNEIIPDLQDQLAARLSRIENLGFDQGPATTQRIETQIAALQNISRRFNGDVKGMVQGELFELANDEVRWQVGVINSEAGVPIDMTLPDPQQLQAAVTVQPFDGRNFDQWFQSLEDATKRRIGDEVRRGITEGRTVGQHVRAIAGTRSAGFTDGIIQTSRREAEAIVRTAVGHTQTVARDQLFEANSDVVKGVVWNSTLDIKTCVICQSRDGRFFKLGEKRDPLPAHVNCLHPDSFIAAGVRATAVSKRFYKGDMIVINTASGNKLTCTPNHPILRGGEYVPADVLVEGDNVISDGRSHRAVIGDIDNQDTPSTVKQIFDSFSLKSESVVHPVPLAAPDFHGEGIKGEIAVIYSDSFLGNGFKSSLLKKIFKNDFILRNRRAGLFLSHFLSGFSTCASFFNRGLSSLRRFMSVLYLRFALIFRHLLPLEKFGFRLCPSCDSVLGQNSANDASGNSKVFRDSVLTHSFVHFNNLFGREFDSSFSHDGSLDVLNEDVFEDKIVKIERQPYSGCVYNLETDTHYYFANGLATHNCRCAYSPVLKSFRELGLDIDEAPPGLRASMNGSVPKDLSYNQWLKRQSASIQEEALGPKRAALFRKGELDVQNFVSRRGNVKTLAQIRELEADAFEKAGL